MNRRALARPRRGDLLLAACFVVAGAIETVVRYHDQPVQLAIAVPGALAWGCLALRRVHPLLTVTVIAGMAMVGSLLQAWLAPGELTNSGVAIIAMMVVSYSLASYGSTRGLMLGAPLPILTILITDLLQPADESLARALPFAVAFVVVAPVIAGRLVRARALAIERLRAQAAELAAHRAEQVAADIAQDRLRLSGLFHDQLLDGMGVLVGEVDRARRMSDTAARPGTRDEGAADIAAIERTARELLAQTRHVVVALAGERADDASTPQEIEPTPIHPQQGRSSSSVGHPADDHDQVNWTRRFPSLSPAAGQRFSAQRWTVARATQPWSALAGAALCAGLIVELHSLPLRAPLQLAVLACALLVVPLALVWVSPLPMTVLLWMFAVLFDAFVAPLPTSTAAIVLVVAAPFAVATLTTRPRAIAGLAVCSVGELIVFGPGNLGAALVISAAGWLAGAVLRERSHLVENLRLGVDRLAEQRAAVAQREIVQERALMARDLHDTVGHSLTVVALQAGAARRLWYTDHDRAVRVLETIASVATSGLAELRAGWEPIEAGVPQHTDVDVLEPLLDGARAAGLPLDVAVGDVWSRLSPEIARVAYRVVQESLTNVLRHAPGAATTVTARADGSVVELGVDNAAGSADSGAGSGRGLIGMRSRVTACGGRLEWDARPDGGFVVRAWLPLAPMETGPRAKVGA